MTEHERKDLVELARRFPDGFIERKEGNDYVAHHVINQRLLSVVGPFDFELVQVIRGNVPAVAPDPQGRSRRARAGTPALQDAVAGGVWRLTATVDGRRVRVEEVGEVGDVHNWPNDGARLKQAASDALKRCAMRLGLGLHLWAQEHYFLDRQVTPGADRQVAEAEAAATARRRPGPDDQPPEADEHPESAAWAGPPPPEGWASWSEHDDKVTQLRERAKQLATDDAARQTLRAAFAEETGGLDPADRGSWVMPRPVYEALVARYGALARARLRPVPPAGPKDPTPGEVPPGACGAVHPDHRSKVCTLGAPHVASGSDHEAWDGTTWPVTPTNPPTAPPGFERRPGEPAWAGRATRPRRGTP